MCGFPNYRIWSDIECLFNRILIKWISETLRVQDCIDYFLALITWVYVYRPKLCSAAHCQLDREPCFSGSFSDRLRDIFISFIFALLGWTNNFFIILFFWKFSWVNVKCLHRAFDILIRDTYDFQVFWRNCQLILLQISILIWQKAVQATQRLFLYHFLCRKVSDRFWCFKRCGNNVCWILIES